MKGLVGRTLRRLDDAQQRQPAVAFALAVLKKAGDDRSSSLAALLAYYGLLALFPLLLVGFTVLNIVLRDHPGLRHDIVDSTLAQFPIVGKDLGRTIHPLPGGGVGLAISLLLLLWGALGITQVAQQAMADVWNVPLRERPGFLGRLGRGLAFIGMLGLGVLAATGLASWATVGGSPLVVRIVGLLGSLVINVALFVAAFRLLTPAPVETRDLVIGAVIAALAWTALQAVGGYLVARQLRHSSELYGFFAIVLGLISWLYLGARVTMYAAEINVVRARHLWPRSINAPPLTEPDRDVLRAPAEQQERREDQHVEVTFEEGRAPATRD